MCHIEKYWKNIGFSCMLSNKGAMHMARAKTFSLGEAYDGILSDLVQSGRFGTETEVVRAGIRMLADYEVKIRSLRQDISTADAEIAAGKGKTYASGAELLDDVMNES
jgi:antitoxin ParD1/3/4